MSVIRISVNYKEHSGRYIRKSATGFTVKGWPRIYAIACFHVADMTRGKNRTYDEDFDMSKVIINI